MPSLTISSVTRCAVPPFALSFPSFPQPQRQVLCSVDSATVEYDIRAEKPNQSCIDRS